MLCIGTTSIQPIDSKQRQANERIFANARIACVNITFNRNNVIALNPLRVGRLLLTTTRSRFLFLFLFSIFLTNLQRFSIIINELLFNRSQTGLLLFIQQKIKIDDVCVVVVVIVLKISNAAQNHLHEFATKIIAEQGEMQCTLNSRQKMTKQITNRKKCIENRRKCSKLD